MFPNHVFEKLSPFCHGELSAEESRQVAEHLRQCERCQRQYEEIRLGISLAEHLPLLSAPASLWADVEACLNEAVIPRETHGLLTEPSRARSWWRKRRLVLKLAFVFVGILGLSAVIWLQHSKKQQPGFLVDLDDYLSRVDASAPDRSRLAISATPPHFEGLNRRAALRAANIAHASSPSPLPGYELLLARGGYVHEHEVVQLVYGKGKEAFSVFVAPESVNFSFGVRQLSQTEIRGIQCRKVDCPRTSVFWFGADSYRCVLVSKFTDSAKIASIMTYFVSAHTTRRELAEPSRKVP